MLRRLLDARADDERRTLPPGERRHKKSTVLLSPARIERMFAVLRAAMNAAVPGKIGVSPCDGVILPRARKIRALAWTTEREAAFRAALGKRIREASAGRRLTTVEAQRLWAAKALRPSPVMVWLPAHTGAFLDFIEQERLYALFCLAAYCGLRRGEILGLVWAEIDLDAGLAYVRETGDGGDPKSDAGVRVPPQWLSVRFETLAYRADLPPVRFHDLRHGAASLCKAADLDTKYISILLGHSRTSFTDATYVLVFPEVAKAAAESAAAMMPRRAHAQGMEN
jgi:integrase